MDHFTTSSLYQPKTREAKQAVNKCLIFAILSIAAAHLLPVTGATILVSSEYMAIISGVELLDL